MSDLRFMPGHELAGLIRAGKLSPLELMEASLARLEETNGILNAFIAMQPEQAMREARELAERIARGEQMGPLAGLPIGVKELEDVEGYPSTHASVPYRDCLPARDSVQVERLRSAGAIVLGKTNSPEFGYTAFTKNLLFGVTRNPWNAERTPGGSSGGSAAAVAAGMVPLATGSDGGGSIRIPAAYTGCFGLRPGFGRVPRGPFEMLGWADITAYGPIARTVRDAALYMDAVVGAHPADPDSLPRPGYSYVEALERPSEKLRVAWSPTLGYASVQPDVLREVGQALLAFQRMGHEVDEVDHVLDDPAPAFAAIFGAEDLASVHDRLEADSDSFGRGFVRHAESARGLTPEKYGAVQHVRAHLVEQLWRFFEQYDLLLTPTVPTEAFGAQGDLPGEIAGRPLEDPLQLVAFTYPFNLSNHPAATVRAGFTDAGLPAGLQIVGPRHREDLVLQAAYAYEMERPWNDRWPVEIAPPSS